MKWRAFYADGRRVSSAEGPWSGLPDHGLVVAVWWDDAGTRHLECGDDALILAGGQIVGVNLPTPALTGAAEIERTAGRLKYGIRMDPAAWARVRTEAEDSREPPAA